MEKMIQALFANEIVAFKGLKAIQELDVTQDISLGETYILNKDDDGNTTIRSAKNDTNDYNAIGGGIIGGLVGLLVGPVGFLLGIGAGMVAGAARDTIKAEGVSDYLDQVSENIPNGKSVLIAHIWEDWEIPIDTVLKPFTTDIFRMNVEEKIFIPVKTELEKTKEEISNAETAYLAAGDKEKPEWNEKLLLLKIKREQLIMKLKGNIEFREKQYEEWIANHHWHSMNKGHTGKVVHDKEKHDRLEGRIAEQKTRLEDLRKNR